MGSAKKYFVRRVQHATSGAIVVAKFLTNTSKLRKDRFHREATEVAKLRTPGILPVLQIDERVPGKPEWYLMPEALPLRPKLDQAPDLRLVVEAFAQLAETLALLASANIYHRDIKPDNLFAFDNQAVLADFGIAYWEDADLTKQVEKIGPMGFLAPEMYAVGGPGPAELGAKADVYSLAQTLFVVARRQGDFPPGGTQWSTVTEFELKHWVTTSAISELRLILEAATRFAPDDRLEMREFAAELRSWLHLYREPILPRSGDHRRFTDGWPRPDEIRRAEEATLNALHTAVPELSDDLPGSWENLPGTSSIPWLGTYDWERNYEDGEIDDPIHRAGILAEEQNTRIVAGVLLTLHFFTPESTPFVEVHRRQGNDEWDLAWQSAPSPSWSRAGLPAAEHHLRTALQAAREYLGALVEPS